MSMAQEYMSAAGGADERKFVPPLPRISIQCFCETEEVHGLLSQAAADRRAGRTHMTVQMGGLAAAREFYEAAPTPNVIALETTSTPDALLMSLDSLAEVCDPDTKVIIIGHTNDILLYRRLIDRGVTDYLVVPMDPLDFLGSISAVFGTDKAKQLGRTLAFFGARGGAGSSTIAHNVAWAISQDLLQDVVIADLDLPFGTSGLNFNQDPVQGIADAIYAGERLDENFLDRLMSKCTDRLSLMASPGTLEREYDVEQTPLDQLFALVRGNVPATVLDVPHMWSGWAHSTLMQADDIIITATPDLTSLRNTKNLVDHLKANRSHDRQPFLVLNQVGIPKRPEIAPKEFGDSVGLEPSAVVAFDPQLFGTAANNGQMIAEMQASAKPVEAFGTLAETLMGKREVRARKRSALSPLLEKLKRKG
ncbi:MAG: CtpF protein [Rhodobiaceae bacterium]|nr:CtpF protein [Rhodobiaceae bacterium]MCC0055140.1 CtpF protein [Rhodobiaceae bacterium]